MICEGGEKFQFWRHGLPADPSFELLDRSSSPSVILSLAFPPPLSISDMDKSLTADIAANGMDESIRLLQSNEVLWIKADRRETLNLESYERLFQSPYNHMKIPSIQIEASRDFGVVIMNTLTLVNMFMDLVC
ncbi:hypothetical protein C2S53_004269 [Perilla frutescens var. hirtella]|uniref:START domain-containing protein n=1 Tax=Perilla frutescens var. hirtella TaxID=608512 RepID=A0AAD4IP27_PERFH|nr:hypothetical protein C2S53_004269 [Perilla frutescens var. hirtella]